MEFAIPGSAARHVSAVRHVTDCTMQPGPFEWRFADGPMAAHFFMLIELVTCSGVVFTQSVATVGQPLKCHYIDVSLMGRR